MNRTLISILGALAASMLFGCAHPQTRKVVDATPPAPATPPPAPVQAQNDEAARKDDDLERLLSGLVIHFDYNADALTSESRSRLQTLAESMRSHADAKIKISGNCDERGTEEYNLALGQRRADVAKKYLVGLGVQASRIQTITYGAERPADPGHSESSWAQNRRDEFNANGN